MRRGFPLSSLNYAMKKKIISIILALTVSITMIRLNTIRSSAFDPTIISDLLRAIGHVTAGAVVGGAAMGLGDCLAEAIDGGLDTWYSETLPNKVTTSANNVFNSDGITVVSTNTGYYAKANESLSGDELEFATILAEKLNNHPMFQTIVTGVSEVTGGSFGMGIKQAAYQDLKTIIGQATAEFTQHKAIEYAKENGLTLIDNGALPVYNFDFVGPIQPGLEFSPIGTAISEYLYNGVTLTKPFVLSQDDVNINSNTGVATWKNYSSKKTEYMLKYNFSDDGLHHSTSGDYAGMYVIYNGTVFTSSVQHNSIHPYLADSVFIRMYSADGTALSSLTTLDNVQFLPRGFYEYSGEYQPYIKDLSLTIDDNTFTSSITPGSVEIPRTEGEQAVIDGINLGLISDNPDLTLDENGNIVKIDGIDTTKLMELLQTIANNGTISFDSVEEYLQTITQLIRVSNADTKTMNTVIANLNELTKVQNANIEAINANVASIAQALAISDTATADNTFDVDTPSTIIDKFPFCLPFDIQRVFNLLSAEPKAPSYDIPITMEGVFDFHISGDLSEYEWIAEIVRWVLYIVFIIGLIMITNKLIGRG